jgi:hypothetical protein
MRASRGLIAAGATAAVLVSASAAYAGPGRAPDIAPCQNGGHSTVVRADGSTFASTGECVSYVARGGVLLPLPPPPPPEPVSSTAVSATVILGARDRELAMSGSGFLPDAPLSFRFVTDNGFDVTFGDAWWTDAAGAFETPSGTFAFPCGGFFGTSATVTVSDGVNSATAVFPILC